MPVAWTGGTVVRLPRLPAPPNYGHQATAEDNNNRGQIAGTSSGRAVIWTRR